MSLCCIGGVCIPYSTVLPLLVLGLKWILDQLVAAGLIPASWKEGLTNRLAAGSKLKRSDTAKTVPCCSSSLQDSNVTTITSQDEWTELLSSHKVVVAKFTASWCRPCQRIQPLLESMADQYSHLEFVIVDVDDWDEIAAQYKVALLPTVLVLDEQTSVIDRYAGSDENKLQELVQKAAATAVESK